MREPALDSVRGLASVAVVLHHAFLVLEPDYLWPSVLLKWWNPLRILIIGRPAVILFFALSGFVLALAIENDRSWTYLSFIVKGTSKNDDFFVGSATAVV